MADREHGRILMWFNGTGNRTTMILNGFNLAYSLFVTNNSDIYVSNGYYNQSMTKWIWGVWKANTSIMVMNAQDTCFSLFLDIHDFLYCSMSNLHRVIKKSLNGSLNTTQVVAGTNCPGVTSNMLNNPQGIFVHINLSLYVADCGNNRIQLFQGGNLNGIKRSQVIAHRKLSYLTARLALYLMAMDTYLLWTNTIIVLSDQDQTVFDA